LLKTLYWGEGWGIDYGEKITKKLRKTNMLFFSLDILTTRKYSGLSNPLHKTLLKLLSSLRSQGE